MHMLRQIKEKAPDTPDTNTKDTHKVAEDEQTPQISSEDDPEMNKFLRPI